MIPLLLGLARAALPEALPTLSADTLRPALDVEDGLMVESARLVPGFTARAHLAWSHGGLRFREPDGTEHAVVGDLGALHLGAGRTWGPLRLGASAPLYALLASEGYEAPALVPGDLALSAKVGGGVGGRLHLAGLALLGLPMGGSARSLGQPGPTGEVRILGETGLGRVTLRLDLGLGVHPTVEAAEIEKDDEISARFGLALRAAPRLSLWVEAFGATGVAAPFVGATSPVEALVGATTSLGQDTSLRVAAGAAASPAIGAAQARLVAGLGF